MKGCDDDNDGEPAHPGLGLIAFTVALGLLFIFFWVCMCNRWQLGDEPDAEPEVSNDPINVDSLDEAATMAEELQRAQRSRQPNAEEYMVWMIERCARCRGTAATHERRQQYEARITILHGLVVEALRHLVLGKIGTISSPSYAAIHAPASLGDAQRPLDVIRALHHGATSASSAVLSINVDTVGNALGRGVTYPSSGSSGEIETNSQMQRRYMQRGQDEVSDPEMWVLLHYGGGSDDDESMDGGDAQLWRKGSFTAGRAEGELIVL